MASAGTASKDLWLTWGKNTPQGTIAKAAQANSKEELKMVEGTVKFFNAMKHFGFIAGDDGKEYFVHSSGLKEGASITEGDKVSFKAVEGDRGLKAEEVEKEVREIVDNAK